MIVTVQLKIATRPGLGHSVIRAALKRYLPKLDENAGSELYHFGVEIEQVKSVKFLGY